MKKYLIALLALVLIFTGCTTTEPMNDKESGTITVAGYGEVMLEPDYAWFTVSSSVSKETTEEAKAECTLMIESALDILRNDYGVRDEDIKTDRMSFWPEYRWMNDERVITGQHAEQQVRVEIRDIASISDIYDDLAGVNGISLSGITLDRKDKAAGYDEARTIAVKDALAKAEIYAEAAGLRVSGIVSIGNSSYAPTGRNTAYAADEAVMEAPMMAKGESSSYYSSDIKVADHVQVTVATETR